MTWVKIKKSFFSTDEPLITVANNRFSFNSAFTKIAELEKNRYVTYFFEEENRRIAFEFKSTEDADCFKVIINKEKGNYSQSTELFSIFWIQKISRQKGINRFKPFKDGKKYIITLMPIFENIVPRPDYLRIPSSACGIYRYIDNGVVVYIGKGNIRDRLSEVSRKEWKFDAIEYSVILDNDSQHEWESYWINHFKTNNGNYFPAYNLVSGKSA